MRVFVSFGFRPEESWVELLVLPMFRQLGFHVIEGKEIAGRGIDEEVRRRIGSADALVAFLLRRGSRRGRDGSYATSDYVRQELEVAIGLKRDVIQVVEAGVQPVSGFAGQYQRLTYQGSKRDQLLADLVRHLREWSEGEMKVRIVPDALVRAMERDVFAGTAVCRYRIVHDGREERSGTASIIPEGGGMFAKLLGFRPGRSAQLSIVIDGCEWRSEYVIHAQPFTAFELKAFPANP